MCIWTKVRANRFNFFNFLISIQTVRDYMQFTSTMIFPLLFLLFLYCQYRQPYWKLSICRYCIFWINVLILFTERKGKYSIFLSLAEEFFPFFKIKLLDLAHEHKNYTTFISRASLAIHSAVALYIQTPHAATNNPRVTTLHIFSVSENQLSTKLFLFSSSLFLLFTCFHYRFMNSFLLFQS